MTFTIRLEQPDGTPADPPTLDDTKAVLEFLESAVRFMTLLSARARNPLRGTNRPPPVRAASASSSSAATWARSTVVPPEGRTLARAITTDP